MSSPELLTQLELVMTEFFTGNTTNERKQEIESQLSNVWQQPDAWRHCLFCISHTGNEYVAMACITALENLINRPVSGSLTLEQLTEIRLSVLQTVQEKHTGMQNFVRNKLVKVVVDVARIQWPHHYPTFLEDIIGIGDHQSPSSPGVVLCLVFLQVATEELAIREHTLMPHTRKFEIRQRLHAHAPHLLAFVTGVLEKLLLYPPSDGCGGGGGLEGTTTPPPSPSQSPHSPPASPYQLGATSTSATQLGSVLALLEQRSRAHYQPPLRWLLHAATAPPAWDAPADNTAYVALNCLTQLLAWLPMQLLAAEDCRVVDVVFTFAALASSNVAENNSSNTVSIRAVACIQEILSRPCIPPALNPLLVHVVRSCCVLVQHMLSPGATARPHLQGGGSGGARQRLAALHPTFLDKVTELVRLLVAGHFRRLEQQPLFNVEEFLALLFRYSFSQPSLDGYLDCLEVWSALLEQLGSRGGGGEAAVTRYHSVLELLAQGVLHKIQLRHNKCELEELDYDMLEETGNDGGNYCGKEAPCYNDAWDEQALGGGALEHLSEQSECQSFFSHNLDLLARLADAMPDKIMDMVVPAWQENCAVYLGLESSLQLQRSSDVGGAGPLKLDSSRVSESLFLSLHCPLRDLCTLLQLLGRLATTFLGSQLIPRADQALAAINRLVELGEFGRRLQLYSLDTSIDLLRTDLIQIHCEVLCSLRAWSHWLSQLYGHQFAITKPVETATSNGHTGPSDEGCVVSSHPHLAPCLALNRQLLVLAASALNSDDSQAGAPWVVVRCGAQLLLTVSLLVVSPVALEVPQVQHLYSAAVYSDNTPPGKVREMVYRALVNFLLLPWPSYSGAQPPRSPDDRRRMLHAFLHTLTQPLHEHHLQHLQADPAIREKASSGIKECLCLVRSQLCQLSGADRNSRELYWSGVREPLGRAVLHFLPLYSHSPGVVLEVMGAVMGGVGVVGSGGGGSEVVGEVCEWVQRLMALVRSRHYLAPALENDQSPHAAVLARFLQLLSLVLRDPSPSFQRLVGPVVATLDELYPLVAQQPSAAAVRQPVFAVLRTLLEHNWKYFYRSSIQQPLSGSAWEDVQHGEQLSRILQAFGQSFMQTDIAVFRHNLNTLEMLNTKFRLYSKSVFRPLLSQFLTVLLQVLLHGSHALLQDEIVACVYHMAAVELPAFHEHFLEAFLRNMHQLTDPQRQALRQDFTQDTDFPTFSQSVLRMINDLRFYRSINGAQET